MPHRVSAIKTEDYSVPLLKEAVRRHVAALEAEGLFVPGVKVVLKPNLLMKRRPEEATTTHPALVQAVAAYLLERGVADITVADSPGGPYTKSALEWIYTACGLREAAGHTGMKLNLGTGCRAVASGVPDSLCGSFNIIDPVREADVVINLPKLKTHGMMTLSGGVKNLFGCVPGLQKPELHFRFPEKDRFGRMLVELAETVCPQLTIVDAVVAMEGDGPSAGRLKQVGWTFASTEIHALDVALCDLAGLDAAQVPTIVFARQKGLAPAKDALVYVGDGRPGDIAPFVPPSSRSVDFARVLPGPLQGLGRRLLSPRPVIRKRKCVGCGNCAQVCPAGAIDMPNKKPGIDYRKCIKCYCCHELCPVRAVYIRRFRLLDW